MACDPIITMKISKKFLSCHGALKYATFVNSKSGQDNKYSYNKSQRDALFLNFIW
jgi:hypothetical protein